MNTATSIEWTETTWNPTTGCDRISPGCDHCYALTFARRLKAMGQAKYQTDGRPPSSGPGFGVAIHPQALTEPLSWQQPRLIFVNSMSDLFHARVPDAFIVQVFAVMAASGHHTYQVLTKRPIRMAHLLAADAFPELVFQLATRRHGVKTLTWPLPNIWLGTSVEDQQRANQRIPKLLATPAAVRFLSCEPLLGPIDLSWWLPTPRPAYTLSDKPLTDEDRQAVVGFGRLLRRAGSSTVDWVIAGGESGPGHRPVDRGWVRWLRDQATAAGVAFFFKQWGGPTPSAGGRLLDGRSWDQYPTTRPPSASGHKDAAQ
jgi:protein gp37